MPHIETHYWPKPVPSRVFDWSAIWDNYEGGDPVGHGPTEEAAIEDLKQDTEARYGYLPQ